VPKVDAFAIDGLDIRFHSNDHLPPHLHVTKPGEWSIRVFVLESSHDAPTFDFVFGRRIPGPVMKALGKAISEHRQALLREWEEKVQKEASDA
jgi:hypothetical protein